MDIVTVLADTAFDFPGPEIYDRLEREGFGAEKASVGLGPPQGARLAAAFKALREWLSLAFGPMSIQTVCCPSSPSIISIKVREALADRLTMTGNVLLLCISVTGSVTDPVISRRMASPEKHNRAKASGPC